VNLPLPDEPNLVGGLLYWQWFVTDSSNNWWVTNIVGVKVRGQSEILPPDGGSKSSGSKTFVQSNFIKALSSWTTKLSKKKNYSIYSPKA